MLKENQLEMERLKVETEKKKVHALQEQLKDKVSMVSLLVLEELKEKVSKVSMIV